MVMNSVKDKIPVLLYKGISKDKLRKIIRSVASENVWDSPKLVSKTASSNFSKIRQTITQPHLHNYSKFSKVKDEIHRQDLGAKATNTKHTTSGTSCSSGPNRKINSQSLYNMTLPTGNHNNTKKEEKSYCIVLMVNNNLKKQSDAKCKSFSNLNENISRSNKRLSLDDMTQSSSMKNKNLTNKFNDVQEFSLYGSSENNKNNKVPSAKVVRNDKYLNVNGVSKQNHYTKTLINDYFNIDKAQNSLIKQDLKTTEKCILNSEKTTKFQKHRFEPEPNSSKTPPSKGLENQVNELSDIDYNKKDIKDKNLEFTRLSEKDFRKIEKVMKQPGHVFKIEEPIVHMIQTPQSVTNKDVLKNAIIEKVNKNIELSKPDESKNNFSNKQINKEVSKIKIPSTSLYERLQSSGIFMNALSSVPKKPNGLKELNSEYKRRIEVPPVKYIYMKKLNENITDTGESDKNYFVSDTKELSNITNLKPINIHTLDTNFGIIKNNFQNTPFLKQKTLNNEKLNTIRYYKLSQLTKKDKELVPLMENPARKTDKKLHSGSKIKKKSFKINPKQTLTQNKLLKKKPEENKMCDYTPSDFFLGRTVISNNQIDSTGILKQYDENIFTKYKIDLEPYNINKKVQNSKNNELLFEQSKKKSIVSSESFSSQYWKILNDRAHLSKQLAYARGIY